MTDKRALTSLFLFLAFSGGGVIYLFTDNADILIVCALFSSVLWINVLMLQFIKTSSSRAQLPASLIVIVLLVLALFVSGEISFFALAYEHAGLNTSNNETVDFYTSLYFSIITWTTLGYGDITPKPGLGRILAASEALIGYINMAIFIAILINLSGGSED